MTIPSSLASAFLGYLALVAALMSAMLIRFLPTRAAGIGIAVLVGWLIYDGILGYSGGVAGSLFGIPGIVALVAPVFVFAAVVLVISPVGRYVALRISLPLLIALQTFRVGVELTLHKLWEVGAVPHLLTLPGGNVEMLIGLSAPAIAWLSLKGPIGRRLAVGWGVLGLLSLFNVSARAALTGPLHLIHSEVPNLALGMFPFSFIPGFMAPLAVMLHVFALRAASSAKYQSTAPITA
jgi:hypothetical protein